MNEPTPAEVLAWMARTGRTAADAADHFWGDVTGDERARLVGRIRQWASRARKAGNPAAPPAFAPSAAPHSASNREAEADVTRPPPDFETARLGRVEFLERMLADTLADLAYVRAAGLVAKPGLVAPMTGQALEIRGQLDQAKQDSGRAVSLERSPSAVADEVQRRAKRIAELSARAAEREL